LKEGQECFATAAVRDFIDMSDFLSLVDIVLDAESPGGVYNVSSGEGHSIADVLREVAHALSVELPVIDPIPVGADDIPEVVLDPTFATETLGWKAEIGFQETISRQVAWYAAHGTGEIYSHLADPRSEAASSPGSRPTPSESSSDD
jgi:nucleoside-diphosphate-sugar epimerase